MKKKGEGTHENRWLIVTDSGLLEMTPIQGGGGFKREGGEGKGKRSKTHII